MYMSYICICMYIRVYMYVCVLIWEIIEPQVCKSRIASTCLPFELTNDDNTRGFWTWCSYYSWVYKYRQRDHYLTGTLPMCKLEVCSELADSAGQGKAPVHRGKRNGLIWRLPFQVDSLFPEVGDFTYYNLQDSLYRSLEYTICII